MKSTLLRLGLGSAVLFSAACSGRASDVQSSSASITGTEGCISVENPNDRTTWPIQVCNDARGSFRATFERFGGVEAMGLPLGEPYQAPDEDWYQLFERVEMNHNFGRCNADGSACIAHLGRWDIEQMGYTIGLKHVSCFDAVHAPRENEECLPKDFLNDAYRRNGGLDFYGVMLTPVTPCTLYPDNVEATCFWTERAKVGRVGNGPWQGELLGNKKRDAAPRRGGTPEPFQIPAELSADTLHMKVDQRFVHFPDDGKGPIVTVCEAAGGELVDRLRSWPGGYAHLVIEKRDGSIDTRVSESPLDIERLSECDSRKGWRFHLHESDQGFLKNLDVSSALNFVAGAGNVECSGGVQLSDGLDIDIKNFKVVNGTLQQPDITFTLKGESNVSAKGGCKVKFPSNVMIAFAGTVPIIYQVHVGVGFELSASKASSFRASIGTKGGSMEGIDDGESSFSFTPQIELGVTFYGVIGTYVGADFPITLEKPSGCTPRLWMGVTLKAGANLSLGGLPIGKELGVEITSPLLGPYKIKKSSCD